MCGIFGYFGATKITRPNIERITAMALACQERGRHAWGVAWLSADGRLQSFKRQGPVGHNIELLKMIASEAVAMVGHCRYTTRGNHSHNINNHPHPCDGGWLVHNGTIDEAAQLATDYGLWPSSDCDSEVLALLVAATAGATKRHRMIEALRRARQYSNRNPDHAAAGLWKNSLVVVSDGRPMFSSEAKRGVYFNSVVGGLHNPIAWVRGQSMLLRWEGGLSQVRIHVPARAQILATAYDDLRRVAAGDERYLLWEGKQ